MKLIIDMPKKEYEDLKELIAINIGGRCSGKGIIQTCLNAVKNGTPLDDVKTEIFRQSEQNNENFSHDWNEGFNDGMFHTLTIIRECFKHISGK